jgi:hypothetical protein
MIAMREAHENASEELCSVFGCYPIHADGKMMCGRPQVLRFRGYLPDWSENNT